jgi:hypothetical protein
VICRHWPLSNLLLIGCLHRRLDIFRQPFESVNFIKYFLMLFLSFVEFQYLFARHEQKGYSVHHGNVHHGNVPSDIQG